jgi:membrane-associated phospholipid phosphatase
MAEFLGLRAALAALTIISYAVTFSLSSVFGLRIEYAGFLWLLLPPTISFGALAIYSTHRSMYKALAIAEVSFGCVALAIPMLLSTYLAMRLGRPLADTQLAAMDEFLPFDWKTFIAFVDSRPVLEELLFQSYQSFALQLLGLPVLLCLFGKEERAYRMVIAYCLICLVSSVIAAWYPALGTYSVYKINTDDLKNVNPHFGYFFLDQFNAVRNDPDFVFDVKKLAGIVTFPSVHAAIAALCIWAAWELKWLRYPFIVLNVLMAVSAVSHSNHYFVDILAGIAVTCACVSVISLATHRKTAARKALPPIEALAAAADPS